MLVVWVSWKEDGNIRICISTTLHLHKVTYSKLVFMCFHKSLMHSHPKIVLGFHNFLTILTPYLTKFTINGNPPNLLRLLQFHIIYKSIHKPHLFHLIFLLLIPHSQLPFLNTNLLPLNTHSNHIYNLNHTCQNLIFNSTNIFPPTTN